MPQVVQYSPDSTRRGSILHGPPELRGYLAKHFSSQNFLLKCKKGHYYLSQEYWEYYCDNIISSTGGILIVQIEAKTSLLFLRE